MSGSGDRLASGAKSAMFGPAKVSQERWDEIFGKKEKKSESEKILTPFLDAFGRK
jgi:hypothetical protein